MTALPLFEMLQPGVDHFLDTTQFGAPGILRVIEPLIHPLIHGVEPFVDGIEPSIHVRPEIGKARVINKDPHQYGDSGNSNRKSDLNSLIGHRSLQNTTSVAHNQ
jgi:hypothetical protein